MAKTDTLFMTKADETPWPIPFGAAHTYIAHIREYPPPPRGISVLILVLFKVSDYNTWSVSELSVDNLIQSVATNRTETRSHNCGSSMYSEESLPVLDLLKKTRRIYFGKYCQ